MSLWIVLVAAVVGLALECWRSSRAASRSYRAAHARDTARKRHAR